MAIKKPEIVNCFIPSQPVSLKFEFQACGPGGQKWALVQAVYFETNSPFKVLPSGTGVILINVNTGMYYTIEYDDEKQNIILENFERYIHLELTLEEFCYFVTLK